MTLGSIYKKWLTTQKWSMKTSSAMKNEFFYLYND